MGPVKKNHPVCGREEQRCIQGAMLVCGEKVQDRWWGGAECLQGALGGGGEEMRARSLTRVGVPPRCTRGWLRGSATKATPWRWWRQAKVYPRCGTIVV